MSRDRLLADLGTAVRLRDDARARALFQQLEREHPNTAAELLARLALPADQVAAITAA
ncbi:hypothetical protein [Actinomadura decatromicini]|uniref:hypothetical protein n=1 Tax=Actinomadura decatromicini TaxID=2604572 RepID=UPI001652C4CE|nr:hypothetical protein [Actinomadura decatromicini]